MNEKNLNTESTKYGGINLKADEKSSASDIPFIS